VIIWQGCAAGGSIHSFADKKYFPTDCNSQIPQILLQVLVTIQYGGADALSAPKQWTYINDGLPGNKTNTFSSNYGQPRMTFIRI
jgi:hypothetical protein